MQVAARRVLVTLSFTGFMFLEVIVGLGERLIRVGAEGRVVKAGLCFCGV